ncbi:hypothetical protein LZ30DRAFT_743995 [Colletotrichum cereale]|nr:hypothetical protein LZ30DRAFT_743995 [Colletotrichum cereale]
MGPRPFNPSPTHHPGKSGSEAQAPVIKLHSFFSTTHLPGYPSIPRLRRLCPSFGGKDADHSAASASPSAPFSPSLHLSISPSPAPRGLTTNMPVKSFASSALPPLALPLSVPFRHCRCRCHFAINHLPFAQFCHLPFVICHPLPARVCLLCFPNSPFPFPSI